MTRVVLASASPRRLELLAALVPAFEVVPSDAAEDLTGDPIADAERLALAKAEAVAAREPGALVVGADTIVFDAERSYGKPRDAADAAAMLRALRGRPHTVVTGVAVVAPGRRLAGHSLARVTLAELTEAAVEAYVASGRPLDKAGAYAIQDDDVPTVAGIEGCYCAVVGLPLWRLRAILRDAGLDASEPSAARARCASCPEREA
ncbi:MAG: septum formation protein Maf [Chloroflexi bacterium]|nr:septum formation protein Maf [Chloroflexota bacterium]